MGIMGAEGKVQGGRRDDGRYEHRQMHWRHHIGSQTEAANVNGADRKIISPETGLNPIQFFGYSIQIMRQYGLYSYIA